MLLSLLIVGKLRPLGLQPWGYFREHLVHSPVEAGIALATHTTGIPQGAVERAQMW